MQRLSSYVGQARFVSVLLLSVVCSGVCPTAFAQRVPGCGPDPVDFSQRFLQAIYPELSKRGKELSMLLHAGGPFTSPWAIPAQFEVEIRQYPPGATPAGTLESGGKGGKIRNDVLAQGFFMCAGTSDNRQYLYKFAGGGEVTGKEAWESFVKLLDANPDWSDEESVKEMRAKGASYGPDRKDEFLKQSNIQALEPFLGKVRVLSTEFHLRNEHPNDSTAEVNWVVRIVAQRHPSDSRAYSLFFEPFKGRLFLISVGGNSGDSRDDTRSKH